MTIKKIDEFHKCLDEQRYYDAHEVLEDIWFPRRFENNNEIKLLKGFINAAVSFELYKKGKKPQGEKVWQNYLKYKPLLYKIDSIYLDNYHNTAKFIESIYKEIS